MRPYRVAVTAASSLTPEARQVKIAGCVIQLGGFDSYLNQEDTFSKIHSELDTLLREIDKDHYQIHSTAEVTCNGQTGVEMEALTAASVVSLTIYDMMKWADKGSIISQTKLLHKSGGKSGDYNV